MNGMSMQAVGAYLKRLREGKGLSRDQVAHQIGTNNVQVFRIETGAIDTRGSLLLRFVHVVEGNPDEVLRLLLELGDKDENISEPPPATPQHAPAEVVEALEVTLALQHNQELLAQWVAYGKRLMEQGNGEK